MSRTEYFRQYAREYRKKHPDLRRANNLREKYGITTADYDRMLQEQDFRCAVCQRHHTEFNRRLAVDHLELDEKKLVFGLLCVSCNEMAGRAKDDPEIAESLARYLRSSGKASARTMGAIPARPSRSTGLRSSSRTRIGQSSPDNQRTDPLSMS